MHSKSDTIEIMNNDKADERPFSVTSFNTSNWVGNINQR